MSSSKPTSRRREISGWVARLFQGAHQGIGVAQESSPGGGEMGAAPPPLEELGAELALQSLYAHAHRGLGDVQTLGRADEIAGGGHGEKGPGEFDVHG